MDTENEKQGDQPVYTTETALLSPNFFQRNKDLLMGTTIAVLFLKNRKLNRQLGRILVANHELRSVNRALLSFMREGERIRQIAN